MTTAWLVQKSLGEPSKRSMTILKKRLEDYENENSISVPITLYVADF